MLSDDYEQEQEELRKKLLRLNEEISEQEEQTEDIDRFISKVRKYLDLDELTPSVLNDMVKAVYVHAPDKSKGHRCNAALYRRRKKHFVFATPSLLTEFLNR
jgi:hypothetical protein